MEWKGEVVPIIYFYQNGQLVWEYALPDEAEITEHGFQEKQ